MKQCVHCFGVKSNKMQSTCKDQVTDKLLFVIQRVELAIERTADVEHCDDLLHTPDGADLFDATCMRIQTIGETLKQIDTETKSRLLVDYPEIPWRKVFAMRNIISHEYLSVDPQIITDIVKHNLPTLLVVLRRIMEDLNAGKLDAIFG